MIFDIAGSGPIHFDSLCDEVVERIAEISYHEPSSPLLNAVRVNCSGARPQM